MDLINTGLVNKWRLLLQFYKQAGLNESELILVLLVMHLSNSHKRFITPDILVKYSNFTLPDIDNIFIDLKNKGFISLPDNALVGTEMNFSPLFNKIIQIMNKTDDTHIMAKQVQDVFGNIIGRELQENEINSIVDLVMHKISISYLEEEANKVGKFSNYDALIQWLQKLVKNAPQELTKFNWIDN